MVAGVHIAANSVLGRIKTDELNTFGIMENVDCGFELVVDTCGISNQTHTFAAQPFEIIIA